MTSPSSVSAPEAAVVFIEARPGQFQTRAIQDAIDACSSSGGGRVVLLAGEHLSGTVHLKEGVDLHLEAGAVLRGSRDVSDYFVKPVTDGARVNNGVATALVFAEKASRIAITGAGVIDGEGESFWEPNPRPPEWALCRKALGTWVPGFGTRTRPRPRALVLLVDCEDVRIEDVTLRNSPAWTLHLLACSRVTVRSMTLRGAVHGSNTDGVDLDACSDVLLEDCDIETGDDALCLKNTGTWGLARPSRRILARRCRLASTTHGFTIGTETRADFEDITLEHSSIEQSGGWPTLTGIGLSMLDGAAIRGVTVRDVTVSGSVAPLQLRLGNAGRGQTTPRPGSVRGLVLEKIRVVRALGNSFILGLPGHPLRDVVLRDVTIECDNLVAPALVLRELPEFDTEFPPHETWRFLPAHALYCRHVEGLELSRVSSTTDIAETRPALILSGVTGLRATDVNLRP